MKLVVLLSASFLVGFLLGDAHGYTDALQLSEAVQWAN